MVRQERVEEYFASTDISQSQLKFFLGPNPSLFNTQQESDLYYEEKEHFIIGDGVDIQLTGSMEDFNNKFHVSNVQNKPSDKMKSIVNQIFDTVKENYPSSVISSILHYRDIIVDVCNAHEYYPTWKEDSRVNKVIESWEYWEDLKASQGKTVLSQEENDKISAIVMSFRTHPHTREYFKDSRTVDIHYQVPIHFQYEDVGCRALLDMIRIHHVDKTIQPIDIKTLGDSTLYFPKSLRKRRYDIQAAFYTEALKTWRMENGLERYTILPFKFLVESTIYPGTPLVFNCSDQLLEMGKTGRKSQNIKLPEFPDTGIEEYSKISYMKFEEIKGFHQLVRDYKWYMEHGFEMERRISEALGEFNLDWDGII